MKSHLVPGPANAYGVSDMTSSEADTRIGLPEKPAAGEDDLTRIDAALRRLEDGRFGLCLYCGDQISLKRLDRDPAIMSCGTCDED